MDDRSSSAIAEQFLPLAFHIASSVWYKGGCTKELDELKGEATLILIKAIRSHDPLRGELEKHIKSRLYYDLLSNIRDSSHVSRDHYEAIKAGKATPIQHIPICAPDLDGDEFNLPIPALGRSPEEIAVESDQIERFISLGTLTKDERTTLQGFRADQSLAEIATSLQLSPGRISQLLKRAKEKFLAGPSSDAGLKFCEVCGTKLRNDGGRTTRQKRFCSPSCRSSTYWKSRRQVIDELVLHDLYVRQKLSMDKIGKVLGCSRGVVWTELKRHNIPRRKAAVIAKALCKCGEPVIRMFDRASRKWEGTCCRRCRYRYLLKRSALAKQTRILKPPKTFEQRSASSHLAWEKRRERFGYRGQADTSTFRSFTEARTFVWALGLRNQQEWIKYCKSGQKPEDVPATPCGVYPKEWASFGDWLGTGFVANRRRHYRSFAQARRFARTLNLKSAQEWSDYCKSGLKPDDIPAGLWRVYANEWTSFEDFAGYGRGKVVNMRAAPRLLVQDTMAS